LQLNVEQSDTPVYRAPLIVIHRHPARDFVEGAQTTSANLITQHCGTVTDAG
jgi:hypothetical protein